MPAPGGDGEPQLGADAVGAGDQHGLAPAPGLEGEEPAEASDAAQHAGPAGALHRGADARDEGISGVDVDAGLAVGERCGCVVGAAGHGLPPSGKRGLHGNGAGGAAANAGPRALVVR